MVDAARIRQALRESLPEVDQAGADPDRPPAFTYVPPSHAKALDPDVSVVEGIRGSGKSFWWAHLSSEPHRKFIGAAFPETRFGDQVRVEQGFGAQSSSTDAPSQEVLASLVEGGYSTRVIWRAVLAHKAGFGAPFPSAAKWRDRVQWVRSNPEDFDELLLQADLALQADGKTLVILFDALDRLGDEWATIRPLAKGLLQIALDLRATKRIRLKVFVRPDMLQDREIIGFPDASKLLARKAALVWRRADLYALLFQCLGNANHGGLEFRQVCQHSLGLAWTSSADAWLLPLALRTDETVQEQAFIALAGKAMASGPSGYKRGKPYTWLVNHLQDGLDQVSPRSFFAAIRQAADETSDATGLPLDYKAIQSGVQAASQIRVDEITREDYPWVEIVMQPLKGKLTVPCSAKDMEALWDSDGTLQQLRDRLKRSPLGVKLPPQRLDEGVEGVLSDLASLGLVKRLADGRVQMPDLYRIAFGLGRRGGVKRLK
ncbi:MAG TPA: hypothetical protein PKI03_38440 [Pseudomonadota bacterium]|jgi:hypothetical protein|nr:hypothetical protein [Pseudomonadota bacterium]